jgi:predicted MFS family arabinose efflux permease
MLDFFVFLMLLINIFTVIGNFVIFSFIKKYLKKTIDDLQVLIEEDKKESK